MPLPVAHSAIGFATHNLCNADESGLSRWKALAGIVLLSNLPDLDVLLGIALYGNGNVFHRGPSHSLVFALIGGFLASRVWGLRLQLPKLSFRICSLLILSHVVADLVLTNSPVSFFWPIMVNWTDGHVGLRHVVNLILFGNYQDAKIIIGSVSFILLRRTLLRFGALRYRQ
jgi:inner membrane protein